MRSPRVRRPFLPFAAIFAIVSINCAGAHQFRPALVGNGPKSLANLIDEKKLAAKGQGDAVVMFEAAIAPDDSGFVASTWCHGGPESKLLKTEVQNALLHASFVPAAIDGKLVPAVFHGTVVFAVRNGQPHLRVFANQDREALAQESDFIEPQELIGTDDFDDAKPYLEVVRHHTRSGRALLSITVDAGGKLRDARVLKEDPTGLNIGAAALKTYSSVKFIPGFRNGSPVTCTVERDWAVHGFRRR